MVHKNIFVESNVCYERNKTQQGVLKIMGWCDVSMCFIPLLQAQFASDYIYIFLYIKELHVKIF